METPTTGTAMGRLPDVPLTELDAERIDELVLYCTHTILNADEPALVWGALITVLLHTSADHCPKDGPANMPEALAIVGQGPTNLDAFMLGVGAYVHVLGQHGDLDGVAEVGATASAIDAAAGMVARYLRSTQAPRTDA